MRGHFDIDLKKIEIKRIEEELKMPVSVVATGGLANEVIKNCKREIEVNDNLLLDGLKEIFTIVTRSALLVRFNIKFYRLTSNNTTFFLFKYSVRRDLCPNEIQKSM